MTDSWGSSSGSRPARVFIGCVAAGAQLCAFAPAASAQQVQARRVGSMGDAQIAFVRTDDLRAMADLGQAFTLSGLPLPDRGAVDLRLSRFRVTGEQTRFVVGSKHAPDRVLEIEPDRVTLLRGEAPGLPGSRVFIAVGPNHTTGTIDLGDGRGRYALTSRSGGGVALRDDEVAIVSPGATLAAMPAVPMCGVDPVASARLAREQMSRLREGRPVTAGVPQAGLRQVEVAIETDYEYAELFGVDLDAAADYVVELYGAVSDIFIRDAEATVFLTFVRLWDTPDDLFNEPDPLGAFRTYWNANMGSVPRDTAQFCSGRRNVPWGGVAYLPGLCSTSAYSVIGYVHGSFVSLDAPHVYNHDVVVAAHEIGHSCGTAHTHDYGLDQCHIATSQPRRGTIMAYCGQTFTGGAANHDLRFDTLTGGIMHNYIRTLGCIASDCNGNGIPDDLDIAGGTSADTNADGVPDECQDCNGNGILDPQEIALGLAADLNGNGRPDDCDPDCNGNGYPDDLDFVDRIAISLYDDFETDMGWTPENLGATSGDWQRGVPVNDPGWPYDPTSDSDGSGQCWLTQNEPGNTDVDNGSVRLTSPRFDMTGPARTFGYDYFLRLTNSDGADSLLVEINSTDGVGPWIEVVRHTTDGGLTWRRVTHSQEFLASLGVTFTNTMRIRFTATDADTQSIVEAGLDAFTIGELIHPASSDAYLNGIPDECEEDLDGDGVSDYTQIQADMSLDLDRNARLDAYQDCDGDGTPDLVALDGANDVVIASLDHTTLRQYLWLTGTYVRSSDDAGLDQPMDLRVTNTGRVLVSSRGDHRVVEFDAKGAFVRDFVPSGTGGLSEPTGMRVAGPILYVSSAGTDSVMRFDAASGAFLGEVIAPGAGGLAAPFGVAVGPAGDLFVTSDDAVPGNGRVLRFASNGVVLGAFVDAGSNGGLSNPRDLMFLPGGNLLVVSYGTDSVLEYDRATGAFIRKFNRNGTATVLTSEQPTAIRLGPDGGVYLSITHDHEDVNLHLTNARIFHFNPVTGNLVRAYVQSLNSNIQHPTGFDFLPGAHADCNLNLRPDSCDIALGFSLDLNGDGVPDECGQACPADCNEDGALNIFDFLCFSGLVTSEDPRADCNNDGAINIFDFLCFQGLVTQGCP